MCLSVESYVEELYKKINISDPIDLNLQEIAHKLNITITYNDRPFSLENEVNLIAGSECKEWMLFGHEICHVLRHVGNQLNMHHLFVQLQEYQADYFAYHFCVPTFMLEQIKGVDVYDITQQFNVDFFFALRRLEMYQSKILERGHLNVF